MDQILHTHTISASVCVRRACIDLTILHTFATTVTAATVDASVAADDLNTLAASDISSVSGTPFTSPTSAATAAAVSACARRRFVRKGLDQGIKLGLVHLAAAVCVGQEERHAELASRIRRGPNGRARCGGNLTHAHTRRAHEM